MTEIWAFLVARLGRAWATAAALLVVLILTLGPPAAAYRMGWTARDEQAKAEAQADRIDALEQLIAFGERTREIVGDYVLRRGQGQIVYRTLKQEVPRVVTVYRTAPDAASQALPACLFTRGFVRVWDAALVPDTAAGASEATEQAGAAAADEPIAEGIGQRDILANHVENAELIHQDRAQCEALITWAKALPGGK